MSEFIPLKRNCPVCGGIRKDCRQNSRNDYIHCRHNEANPPNYIFLGTDKWGFGMWANQTFQKARLHEQREEWRREREAQLIKQQERLKKLLSVEERSRHYHKLPSLNQKYLSTSHRENLRSVRGLSEAEINWAVDHRWFHTWQSGMQVYGISPDLAGVKLTGTNLSLLGVPGIAIAAMDFQGYITGFQIASDDREYAKYLWLSSASKGGNGPHLLDGELPLFVYRHPQTTQINEIWLVEGALKPAIVALILWLRYQRTDVMVIGAAGGNFSASAKLLEATISASNCSRVVFCPDAGSTENTNLVGHSGAYRRTFALLDKIDIQPTVAWWGQETKEELDIDELLVNGELFRLELVQPEEFWAKCSNKLTFGKQVQLQSEFAVDEETTYEQWLLLQASTKFQKLWQEFSQKVDLALRSNPLEKRLRGWVEDPQFQQFIRCLGIKSDEIARPETPRENLAIVPYRGIAQIHYQPGQLPSFEEWLKMGKPKVIFQAGERRQLNIEAYQKGFRATLDRSIVGYGKSHDSGLYTRSDFSLVEKDEQNNDIGGRIFIISADHKNPTTQTVEYNTEDLISRHNGETLDYSRLTPLGKPYRIRTPKGKQPDIPANCPETDTFIIAFQEKDSTIFGGKDSPICQRCPYFSSCEFLSERYRQLKTKNNLRAHIDSLGIVSDKDIAIVDEPGTLLQATKTLIIDNQEMEAAAFKLQQEDAQAYGLVAHVIRVLVDALASLSNIPEYGLSHGETLVALAGQNIDRLQLEIWKRYQKLGESFEHPLAAVLRAKLEETHPSEDAWSIPGVAELESQIAVALSNKWQEILEGCQTPEEKQNAIYTHAVLNWLSPLIKVINGQDRYTNIQVTQSKKLKITQRSYRHRRTLSNFRFLMFLDSTISKSDLQHRTGIKHILEIEQYVAPDTFKNLLFRVVKGLGKNPKGTTAKTTWQRTNAAVKALIDQTLKDGNTKEEQIAVIGFKGELNSFQVSEQIKLGYWFKDSRGNNRYDHIHHLIIFGLPKPNLSERAAEWHTLTGQIIEPTDLQSKYGNWYQTQVRGEIVQISGRPRAHLKPDVLVEVTFLAGDAMNERDLDTLKQKFPGCSVEIIEAYNLSPIAASKGVQKTNRMVEVAWEMVQAGITPKVEQLAEVLKVNKSRISQLVKEAGMKSFRALVNSLVFLYEAIQGKTKLLQLDEEARCVAETFLTTAAKDLENSETVEEVVELVATAIQSYHAPVIRRILAATPPSVLCKLFSSLMSVVISRLILPQPSG